MYMLCIPYCMNAVEKLRKTKYSSNLTISIMFNNALKILCLVTCYHGNLCETCIT